MMLVYSMYDTTEQSARSGLVSLSLCVVMWAAPWTGDRGIIWGGDRVKERETSEQTCPREVKWASSLIGILELERNAQVGSGNQIAVV